MSLQRLLFMFVLAVAASVAVVSDASAGGIRDWEPCPDNAGNLICPVGTTGVPYSIKFRAVEEPPCQPGEDTWHIVNDAPPPGLNLASDGTLSGTPTQAGTYGFWVEMRLPDNDHCNGTTDTTQERFVITINQGAPVAPPPQKLTIGPASVRAATVGTPYMAAMTANLSDPKTWSISAGILPPGLNLGASDGLISGTPTAVGAYAFTVQARIDATRTATQSLTINVRDALTVAGPTDPALEVGVFYRTALKGNGGLRTYRWALTAGAIPPGLTFFPGGAITGRPTTAGEFEFTVTLTDSEGRTTTYDGSLTVAARLAVATTRLTGRAGRVFRKKVVTRGGIDPTSMRLKKGQLPGGVRFDRATASFVGIPKKAGTWIVLVEVVDALKVKAKATIVLVVRA